MKGYRTLVTNGIAFLAAMLAGFGVVVEIDETTAITAGVLALVNIALRFITSTRVGEE